MSFPQQYSGFSGGPKLHLLEWAAPHVVRVAFNRAPVNALSTALWKEMQQIFEHLGKDGDVRAVVFNGEGRCFTAGLDCEHAIACGIDKASADLSVLSNDDQ